MSDSEEVSGTEAARISNDDGSWHEEQRPVATSTAATTSPSQRALRRTSVPDTSKRRVDLATEGEGLSGKRCLVENTDEVTIVHYAHCLAKERKIIYWMPLSSLGGWNIEH